MPIWTSGVSLPKGFASCRLRVPREMAPEVVKYSFLRLAREMPHLRQFRPVARATPGFLAFHLPACRSRDRSIVTSGSQFSTAA